MAEVPFRRFTAAVLSAHERLFALTRDSIGRTERQMALARLMSERGITDRMGMGMPGERPTPGPDSVIVGVFAPVHLGGIMYDLGLSVYRRVPQAAPRYGWPADSPQSRDAPRIPGPLSALDDPDARRKPAR